MRSEWSGRARIRHRSLPGNERVRAFGEAWGWTHRFGVTMLTDLGERRLRRLIAVSHNLPSALRPVITSAADSTFRFVLG